jgi:hypothetical protein
LKRAAAMIATAAKDKATSQSATSCRHRHSPPIRRPDSDSRDWHLISISLARSLSLSQPLVQIQFLGMPLLPCPFSKAADERVSFALVVSKSTGVPSRKESQPLGSWVCRCCCCYCYPIAPSILGTRSLCSARDRAIVYIVKSLLDHTHEHYCSRDREKGGIIIISLNRSRYHHTCWANGGESKRRQRDPDSPQIPAPVVEGFPESPISFSLSSTVTTSLFLRRCPALACTQGSKK